MEFFTLNIIHWITNLKIFDHHKKFAELIQNAYQEMITNMENAFKIDAFLNKFSNIYIVQFKTKDSGKDKVTKKKSKSYSLVAYCFKTRTKSKIS